MIKLELYKNEFLILRSKIVWSNYLDWMGQKNKNRRHFYQTAKITENNQGKPDSNLEE